MSTALGRAKRHLEQAVAELEQSKAELPTYARDAAVLARAEVKVTVRRLGNLAKAIGDPLQ